MSINRTSTITGFRLFHTTRSCRIFPIIKVAISPLARVATIVLSRFAKVWWKKLPETRKVVFRTHFKRYKYRYGGGAVLMAGGAAGAYRDAQVVCPYTLKKRVFLFNTEEFEEFNKIIFEEELESESGYVVNETRPEMQTVRRIVNRIVNSHEDLKAMNWQVAVIESPKGGAFSLGSGHIVVYTGMMKLCDNEDQLAAVLAHEMAHVLLKHQLLTLSQNFLNEIIMAPLMFLSYLIVPSDLISVALLYTGFTKMVRLSLELPYSREMEIEADVIGLHLMAMACYDVREAPAFWEKLQIHDASAVGTGDLYWLSTHPNHKTRKEILDRNIPTTLALRLQQKCYRLSCEDPRDRLGHSRSPSQLTQETGDCCTSLLRTYPTPPIATDYYQLRDCSRMVVECPKCLKHVDVTANSKHDKRVPGCECATEPAVYITLPLGVEYDGGH